MPLPAGGRMQANALYNQLAPDARCHDVVVLSYEERSERRFAGGSMGSVNFQRLNPSPLPKYSAGVTFDLCGVTGEASMAHLDDSMAGASIKVHGTFASSAAS